MNNSGEIHCSAIETYKDRGFARTLARALVEG
jgi:hypothetical protein